MTESQPVACTLTGDHFRDRVRWIEQLTRDALQGYDRADLTLRLRYALSAMPRVQEMVNNERACCSFLSFHISERAKEVWLTIAAPENTRTSVETLFETFLPK